ncbi:MAG: aldose 1-epimerase family protein [Steroidobacteraceae bacterium]
MSDSWITLQSAGLLARIDPQGAQLSVLRDATGRELLWHGDASIWAGRSPILFPIVGTLAGGQFRLGSGEKARRFSLPRHGFARNRAFELIAHTPSTALFRLASDESTLAVYPFPFELDACYELHAATLTVVVTVRNTGSETLPASVGLHPGFRWPLDPAQPRSAHLIEFASPEPLGVRRIGANGLLLPDRFPTPVRGRRLGLGDALFQDDVLIFDQLGSRSLVFGALDVDGPRLEIGFPDSPWLGLWTRPGAPFLCIEPWQGVSDPDGFDGELWDKPGIFRVQPGADHKLRMTATFSYSRPVVSN